MKFHLYFLVLLMLVGVTACNPGNKKKASSEPAAALKAGKAPATRGSLMSVPRQIIAPQILQRLRRDNAQKRPVIDAKTINNLQRSGKIVRKIQTQRKMTRAKLAMSAMAAVRRAKCFKLCQGLAKEARPTCMGKCKKSTP